MKITLGRFVLALCCLNAAAASDDDEQLPCGKSNYQAQLEVKDFGLYVEAKPGQFPFAARLIRDKDDSSNSTIGEHHCNAVIFDESRLVTAYGCVVDEDGEYLRDIRVIVGDHDMEDPNDGGYRVEPKSYAIYSDEKQVKRVLINLLEPLTFKLPPDNKGAVNKLCFPSIHDPLILEMRNTDHNYHVGWHKNSKTLSIMRDQVAKDGGCNKLKGEPEDIDDNSRQCLFTFDRDKTTRGSANLQQLEDGRYIFDSMSIE